MQSKAEYIAEILLGVFVEGLLAKLRSIVIEQHISFELGFKEGLTGLFSFLTQIQLVLNDVEKRQASDEFMRIWLAKLRYVAYDIDDVLDEFGYNILQQKVLNYSSPSNDIINMANKIKIIYESLNRLKVDIASYELRAELVNLIPKISFNMEIDSFLDDSKVNQNVGNNTVEATYCDRVTEITETFTQYELTEYDRWFIFKKRAFANERLLTLDLEKIGNEIVKKCKRVPWAVEFLGTIMYFIHDKDYNMKKDKVIQHWMAERFLEPSTEGNTVMEDIGNTYFNILLATSFFQNARKDVCGDIISCKMHNLVHDFAISISKSEILILEGDFVDNGMCALEEWKDAKELTSAGCGINELPSGLQFCASLQYLKIEDCPNLKSIPDLGELFHSLINLKLSNSHYQRLKLWRREDRLKTSVIEELDAFPSLRYPSIRSSHASLKKLRLRGWPTLNSQFLMGEIRHFTALEELCIENFNGMEALSDWLSYLSSLQNLCLYYCKKLMSLPIPHLTNLKHLNIAFCPNLEKRCADGSGAEWFKIAHIPNIKINGKYIPEKDSEDSEEFDVSDFYDSD
uniref:Rx N-terminal domain-containing protein n=1 Tax=Quercus lobata TaxID=97700 RepID=A0A7N2MTG7_QUELO